MRGLSLSEYYDLSHSLASPRIGGWRPGLKFSLLSLCFLCLCGECLR